MAKIKPFKAWRPAAKYASKTAALPYDVFNRSEARTEALKEPLSFLNIDRPETQFPENADMYSAQVYEKAASMLKEQMHQGVYIQDDKPCSYIYELTMDGRSQTGLVACASVDDYMNNVIKKHENTKAEKEEDRIRHVDICSAQTGPIFLAYHAQKQVDEIIEEVKKSTPVYDFISEDGIGHRCWVIDHEDQIEYITAQFDHMASLYIADGHHRAASAVKVGLRRRKKYPEYYGNEEFNSFLSVIFPDNQLKILPYYRVVRDLNHHTVESFFNEISTYFDISDQTAPVAPEKPYVFGCYLEEKWYRLELKPAYIPDDPVDKLDVSVLQNLVLAPVLGIKDPKTDHRIDFVGGIRGVGELERRCKTDMKIAFSTYATTIGQLFDVADAGRLMPPKSTWFEPKLRSGLFIHQIEV